MTDGGQGAGKIDRQFAGKMPATAGKPALQDNGKGAGWKPALPQTAKATAKAKGKGCRAEDRGATLKSKATLLSPLRDAGKGHGWIVLLFL